MATTFAVGDHHVLQFAKNQELLLQQKQPRLLTAVTQATYQSKGAQKVVQYGETKMEKFEDGYAPGQWKGETVLNSIEHFQRWVFPQSWKNALYLSEEDLKRMITDPKSPYAETMRAAWARTIDETIIEGAFGDNKTGVQGEIVTAFNTANTIPAGGTGLTIDKLIEAQQIMLTNHVDMAEGVYFIFGPQQLSDLLQDEDKRVMSFDFNTQKALMTGQPGSLMSFNFILSYHLPVLSTGVRGCMAWVKSGMHLGMWGSNKFRVSDRPDLNHLTQLWMSGTLGATRTQENKFVQIECADPTAV